MQNDTTVNDIVTKAAEANQSNSDNGKEVLEKDNTEIKEVDKVDDKTDLSDKLDLAELDSDKKDVEKDKTDTIVKEAKTDTSVNDLLKELGLTDISELKEKLKAPAKELSPEEKEKQESIYKANIQKFAVEKGEMKLEDFTKLENLKNKADRDLVYDNWLEDWKEENEGSDDLENLDESEIAEKAKEDFEKEFKLSSTNEKVKAKGEAKLAKAAKEIRQPLESSYNKVKDEFDREDDIRKTYPDYDKTVRKFVNEKKKKKFDFYKGKDGEIEIPIDIELSKEDKAEIAENIAKKIQNPETFSSYKKGELEALQKLAKTETDNFIFNKYKDEGLKRVAETFLSTGYKKGLAKGGMGAKNSFAVNQAKNTAEGMQKATDAKTEVLNSLQGK